MIENLNEVSVYPRTLVLTNNLNEYVSFLIKMAFKSSCNAALLLSK